MPELIKSIKVEIRTATVERAARDGVDWDPEVQGGSAVFLGVAGREFNCDTEETDFSAGHIATFIFGGDANVRHAPLNDPQKLSLSSALENPVYIRFDNKGGGDAWCLERAEVEVTGASGARRVFFAPALDGDATLWLAPESGFQIYLFN